MRGVLDGAERQRALHLPWETQVVLLLLLLILQRWRQLDGLTQVYKTAVFVHVDSYAVLVRCRSRVACNGLLVEWAGLTACRRRKVVMIATGCEEGLLDSLTSPVSVIILISEVTGPKYSQQ